MPAKRAVAELTDEELASVSKLLYERGRLKGKALRDAEKERRKAGLPPPTINEAIMDRFGRYARLHTFDQREDQFDAIEATYVSPEGRPVAAIRGPELPEEIPAAHAVAQSEFLREALALTLRERLARFGYLVGLPYGAKVPEELLSEDTRWDLPAWSLRAAYDLVRDHFFCDLVLGTVDRKTLDEVAAATGSKTKRATHPDEAALSAEQKAHLRRLRVKLHNANEILANNTRANARPEVLTRSRSYVEAAESAIRAARVTCGLAPTEELT